MSLIKSGRLLYIILLVTALSLIGCERAADESLEDFRRRWLDARRNNVEQLFLMLDAGSQREIRQDLEVMRGLNPAAQRLVLDQLGGGSDDFTRLTPSQYFALLWNKIAVDRSMQAEVEPLGYGIAQLILTPGDDSGTHPINVPLVYEGSRWRWQLPGQEDDPVPAPPATTVARNPATPSAADSAASPRRNHGVPPRAAW